MMDSRFDNAMSRDIFKEGGYTFLHQVFNKHFESGRKETVISTVELYLAYKWEKGHKTFMDGISILKGDCNSETYKNFESCAGQFQISLAFEENQISEPFK